MRVKEVSRDESRIFRPVLTAPKYCLTSALGFLCRQEELLNPDNLPAPDLSVFHPAPNCDMPIAHQCIAISD